MRRLMIFLAAVGALLACAGPQTADRSLETPDGIFGRAQASVQSKDYEEARKLLDRIRDEYPFSKFAPEAELLGADVAFQQGKFAEASAAYRSFEDLHPTHPKAAYALYRRGLAHMELSEPEDRDQTSTRAAAEAFQRLVNAYPNGDYAKDALAGLESAKARLAAHEIYVAKYYVRREKFDAALGRLEGVVRSFAGTARAKEAEELMAEIRSRRANAPK